MIFLITYFILSWYLIPHSDFSTNRPLQLSSCPAFAPFWPCPIHSLSTILRYPRNTVSKQQQCILLLLLLFLSKQSNKLLFKGRIAPLPHESNLYLQGYQTNLLVILRERLLMTSLVFWPFLNYLPTLSYSITSLFLGYLGPPYLP